MADQLNVSVSARPSRVLIRLSGECDVTTAPRLQAVLTGQSRLAAPLIIADLSGLRFIDVAVAHTLVEAHDALAREGKRLILLCPQQTVARVLDLTGAALLISVVHRRTGQPGPTP